MASGAWSGELTGDDNKQVASAMGSRPREIELIEAIERAIGLSRFTCSPSPSHQELGSREAREGPWKEGSSPYLMWK